MRFYSDPPHGRAPLVASNAPTVGREYALLNIAQKSRAERRGSSDDALGKEMLYFLFAIANGTQHLRAVFAY